MTRDKWIWMPHPGHFILAHRCHFRLNTYVGNYIVSTVGEMDEKGLLGWEREYETMVFRAEEDGNTCCPYKIIVREEQEMQGYMTDEDAMRGHYELCEKYSIKD